MTTIADLIDYLEQYPRTALVYLSDDHAKEGEEYIALDRLWYAAELADRLSQEDEPTVMVSAREKPLSEREDVEALVGELASALEEMMTSPPGNVTAWMHATTALNKVFRRKK